MTDQVSRRGLLRFIRDREGGVAVLTAMSLSALLGVAGLGTEAALWYMGKRNMQGASDAAAFSAATALAAGQNSTAWTNAAKAISAQYGFTDGSDGVTVSVNNPPSSGGYTTNSSAVEVVIRKAQSNLLFSNLFLASAPTIGSRAVGLGGTGGSGCVMALDRGDVTDISDSGSANLNMSNCSLYINSPSASALTMSGSAQITAKSAYVVGNDSISGTARLNATLYTGVSPATDPYAGVTIPSYPACTTHAPIVSNTTLSAGAGGITAFCNGLFISGSSTTVTLGAGIYVIDRGQFNVSGGATVNATQGTTIILTSSTGASYATVNISGSSSVNITAPPSGSTAGLAFFQDRNAPSSGTNSFSGTGTTSITGAMYFPSQTVNYSGGAGNGNSPCTQILAYKLSFSGSSTISNNCSGIGVKAIGGSTTQLVE